MQVRIARPPNWDQIIKVFPHVEHTHGVYVCWGDTVFNPSGVPLTPELMAHEKVHAKRQGTLLTGIEDWWSQYLIDTKFRLAEELPAHRREYFEFTKRHSNHNRRLEYLKVVAERLSGPFYGGLLELEEARRCVLGGIPAILR